MTTKPQTKIAGSRTIRQAMKAARLRQLTPCTVKRQDKHLNSSRTKRAAR